MNMAPQPWARPGPGVARKPRFDLERFDPAFFDRLRDRVAKAGDAGIYVGVMFFDGWALHLSPTPDHRGPSVPCDEQRQRHQRASIDDLQVLPLDPQVQAIQAAYIRKVVDTVHDLPNVLWEVANESSGDGSVDQEFADFLGLPSRRAGATRPSGSTG